MKAYRILENKNGQPTTLFHGVDGSRTLAMNTWITALKKPVTNPGGKGGTVYISGFHCTENLDYLLEYMERFTSPRELVACEIQVRGTRPKPTNGKILLADKMFLSQEDWEAAI